MLLNNINSHLTDFPSDVVHVSQSAQIFLFLIIMTHLFFSKCASTWGCHTRGVFPPLSEHDSLSWFMELFARRFTMHQESLAHQTAQMGQGKAWAPMMSLFPRECRQAGGEQISVLTFLWQLPRMQGISSLGRWHGFSSPLLPHFNFP